MPELFENIEERNFIITNLGTALVEEIEALHQPDADRRPRVFLWEYQSGPVIMMPVRPPDGNRFRITVEENESHYERRERDIADRTIIETRAGLADDALTVLRIATDRFQTKPGGDAMFIGPNGGSFGCRIGEDKLIEFYKDVSDKEYKEESLLKIDIATFLDIIRTQICIPISEILVEESKYAPQITA
jgi:hypothetical protein